MILRIPPPLIFEFAKSNIHKAIAATNSPTVSPALRIKLRSVPLATSRWSGTDHDGQV
jgi:hypothetical protein